MTDRAPRQYAFLAATTRGFALVALVTASLLAQDQTRPAWRSSASAGVWTVATLAERLQFPTMPTIVIEAVLVGVASGLALDQTFQILTALAFPPFTAALRRGAAGAMASLPGRARGPGCGRRGHRRHVRPGSGEPDHLVDLQPRSRP